MPLPGFENVRVPAVLQPHRVDVQRGTQAGIDNSGMPVEGWATVYAAVPCAIDLHPTGPGDAWEQPVMDLRGTAYFGTPVGSPWPNGAVRYLAVEDYLDELEAGVVGVCTFRALKPGA
jgi:hypothetical protein